MEVTNKACVNPFTLSFYVKPRENGRQLHAGYDIRIIGTNRPGVIIYVGCGFCALVCVCLRLCLRIIVYIGMFMSRVFIECPCLRLCQFHFLSGVCA